MSFEGSELQRPQRWDKPFSDTMTDEDIERLMSVPPFSEIDESQFRASTSLADILKNDTRLVPCEPGDIVIRKGDWGSSAYFILSGRMRVEIEPPETSMPASVLGRREIKRKNVFEALAQLWRNHKSPEFRSVARPEAGGTGVASRGAGERTRVYLEDVGTVLDQYRTASIDSGQFFGEIAALGRTPRVATVFSEGEGELLEIRWQGLRDIMRRDVSLRMYIEEMFRERALASFLRTSSMFSHLNDEKMDQLCAAAEFETFGQYDSAQTNRTDDIRSEPIVAQEGHYPNGVVLIRSGVARLSQRFHNGHRTVGYLTPGQTFGYEEIAEGGKPLRLSLRAIGYLAVVIVPAPVVETLVVQGRKSSSDPLRLDDGRPMQSADAESAGLQVDNDLLEFVVEGRFVQGTASMVIDLDRCTRCDDCVRACAIAHDNNPRFIRHGPIHENYMVANACMHCEDPVCMIECPTGAIHRNQLQGNVIINDQTCIGCSRCANNCPYHAIRMVEIRDRQGNLQIDSRNQPIVQATKCDLCVDQIGGPACQRACPHDALQRIDLRSLVSLGEMVNR